MTAYKLTDADGYTRYGREGETLWAVGKTVTPRGTGNKACGPGVLHLYASAEEAALYDPIHGGYTSEPHRLYRVETDSITGDDGLKLWTTGSVRVLAEEPIPIIDVTCRVAWAICLSSHPVTRAWAVAWLSGEDRSGGAASAAQSATACSWSGVIVPCGTLMRIMCAFA